jgi:hypothetical protein
MWYKNVILKKCQNKQWPNGRKFAQPGHPDFLQGSVKIMFVFVEVQNIERKNVEIQIVDIKI